MNLFAYIAVVFLILFLIVVPLSVGGSGRCFSS